jgi:hypothetical protein
LRAMSLRCHARMVSGWAAVAISPDFFTAEVLTRRGLVTYYVLFFIHLQSRKVDIAGITVYPNESWMRQMARNATMGMRRTSGLSLSPA